MSNQKIPEDYRPYRPCPECGTELMPEDYRNAKRDRRPYPICDDCREAWIAREQERIHDV